jgi:thiosulfate dehydrogenase
VKLERAGILATGIVFALGAATSRDTHAAPQHAKRDRPAEPKEKPPAFQPPLLESMPDDDFGQVVKRGERIFVDTRDSAGKYVGNALSCASCHLDAGRKADAAPLWAAYVSYPEFRGRDGRLITFAERLQDCFRFSLNGKAPPLGDPVLVSLETYAYWLAKGAPVGENLPGRGYPEVNTPAKAPDYVRGRKVYGEQCAQCHGTDGAGQISDGKTVFPPLWGARSFGWGAEMHEIQNGAAFIKANMPPGPGGTLTDQEAWDVAMYMDSHERPQDPRYTGSVAATRKKYHDTPTSMYGRVVNSHVLGSR